MLIVPKLLEIERFSANFGPFGYIDPGLNTSEKFKIFKFRLPS